MTRPYKSPDDRSIWGLLYDIAFYGVATVMLAISTLSHNTAGAVFWAALLVIETLREIHGEVQATRRLTERSTAVSKVTYRVQR